MCCGCPIDTSMCDGMTSGCLNTVMYGENVPLVEFICTFGGVYVYLQFTRMPGKTRVGD